MTWVHLEKRPLNGSGSISSSSSSSSSSSRNRLIVQDRHEEQLDVQVTEVII